MYGPKKINEEKFKLTLKEYMYKSIKVWPVILTRTSSFGVLFIKKKVAYDLETPMPRIFHQSSKAAE